MEIQTIIQTGNTNERWESHPATMVDTDGDS